MSYTSINRVTLVGHLTADPELRTMPSGGSVCSLRLACNSRRRNPDGGYESKPHYFSVAVYGPRSETVNRYLEKGSPVAVDGRLEWREWETTEQQKRSTVSIVATNIQFLNSSRRDGREGTGDIDAEGLNVEISEAELEGVEVDDIDVEIADDVVDEVQGDEKSELVAAAAGGEDDDLLF
jgi:single-strand DNA-binding protein